MAQPPPQPPATLGVILAGGLARRIGGGDKPLIQLEDQTLLEHVARRLSPQCESLILNANGDAARFGDVALPIVPDTIADCPGPLAGILAALQWASLHCPAIEWVVSVPGDTPFIPGDLVRRLHEAREGSGKPMVCAASGSQVHFAVGLWPVSLRSDLHRAIAEKDMRSVRDWAELHGFAEASWPGEPVDPFFNINTPDDLMRATAIARRGNLR